MNFKGYLVSSITALFLVLGNTNLSIGQTSKDNFIQGLLRTSRGEDKQAMPYFNKALELKPDYLEAYMMRGSTYMRLDDPMNAIMDFDKALELDPTMIKAYNYRGFCYLEKKDLRRAISDFSKVIELKPDYPNAFESRGYAKSLSNQHKAALEDYDQAISMKPDFHEAFHHRALSKVILGDTTGGISDLLAAIELNENVATYHDDLGLIYLQTRNLKEALKSFNTSIKVDPAYVLSYLHRGQTKIELNKAKQACKDLTIAAEQGNKEAQELFEAYCAVEEEETEEPKDEKKED